MYEPGGLLNGHVYTETHLEIDTIDTIFNDTLHTDRQRPEMPPAVATKVHGPPGPRMHTPGETVCPTTPAAGFPQIPAALLGSQTLSVKDPSGKLTRLLQ